MKKFLLILTTMLFAIVALAGCGADNKQGQNKVIKVGATSVPHAEILEQIKDDLKKDGITLEIVEYSDYVQPNLNLIGCQLLPAYSLSRGLCKAASGSKAGKC